MQDIWDCFEASPELTAVFCDMNDYMLGMFNNGYLRIKEALPFYEIALKKCPHVYSDLERLFRITDQTVKNPDY